MSRLSKHLRIVIQDDGAILLDVQRGNIVRCNQTGAIILKLLSGSSDERAITLEFARLCGLPIYEAEADVNAFLSCLASKGLLVRNDGASRQG
jgi:hypothetical protein